MSILLTGSAVPAAAVAQTTPAVPPAGSLVVDPQQGATPRPIPAPTPPIGAQPQTPVPTPSPPPSFTPAAPVTLQPLRGVDPRFDPAQPPAQAVPGQEGRSGSQGLPRPSGDPLAIDPARDPVLGLARSGADAAAFQGAIRAAVERNPARAEAEARADEAIALRNEARALEYPTADLSFTYFRVLDRQFSNDPQNILERSRPRSRTDGSLRIQQSLYDFGTAENRIRAARARFDGALAGIDDSATRLALRGVDAWYRVFSYRALVQLGEAFVDSQRGLRGAVEDRIARGVSAPGDVAQVDSYIATAQAQLEGFRRSLATAEAQYRELTGQSAPATLGRAPAADGPRVSSERAVADSLTIPEVEAARRQAEAARFDVRAAKADALPGIAAGIDAGRYGYFENSRDYDIRANVVISQRLGGGQTQKIDQVRARARGADAAYARVREEAARDAVIAWADVDAMEKSVAAVEDNYLATRTSRDVLAERFRVARGSLFDVVASEANYFNTAVRYLEAIAELDIARYTLLARRGKLLETFGITPAAAQDRR